ncbi:MAG: two-component regulator propeller domain-containing protein, partial [Gracilimonas sp.]
VWIGTENNGLNAFNHEKETFQWYKQNLDDPASLSNNSIYSIFENDDHILWIGTYSGAINYIDRKEQKFEHYTYDKNSPHPLSAKSVTSFLEDSQGNFWVGTDGGGLNRFDRNTGYFYPIRHEPGNPNSLSSDVVLALLEASDGYIWIGYYHGGISRFNPENETFTHYRHDPNNSSGLCHDDVFSLYEDEQNTLWVGTNGAGVCRLNDDGTFTKFQAEEGVIRDILIDSNGDFWVGTYGGGLKLLGLNDDEELWNFYEGDNGLRSNIILTLHVDAQNNFWIGTKEGGLTLFDRDSLRLTTRNKRFKSYNMSDGLPGNEIKGILEDDHGNLWMSTNNGISKFVPGEESFFNYNLEDGLQGTEFNTLAYYKDRQGYMYFGGINGFNRFHPDSIKSNPFEYPVVFTDIKLFNNTIQAGEGQPLDKHASQATKMVVPHTATVLTFEYAALNFNALKGIRYAYILEGFEENWNEVGNKRSITYTNLSPGDYTLRVRTVNSDGIWNEDEATLALTVTPPFWQKTWFYLVSFLLAGGFIFGVYRYRVRRITTQNRILINKVAERTSELKEKNKELERVLEDLSETRNELVQKAHKAGMADIAAGVVHNIGNVLNSIGASTSITSEVLKKSKFEGLFKANKMLIDRADNLQQFIVDDPKGKKLIEYYKKLDESIREELETLKQHNQRMEKKVQLINNVITAQQSYASVGLNNEIAKLDVILDDALIIYASSFDKHNISIEKNIQPVAAVSVQKTKLVHVILNILKNAKEAIVGSGMKEGVITINLYNDGSFVVLEISDNGPGIHHNHLDKIYNHGFTTKKDGHGFGLHSSANYMSEMGGKIKAYNSAGDKGAVFVLSFPVNSNGS